MRWFYKKRTIQKEFSAIDDLTFDQLKQLEGDKSRKRLLEEEEREEMRKKFPNDKITKYALIGIVLILFNLCWESFGFKEEYLKTIGHFSRDTGIAFLSGAIIAALIEVPSLLNLFKERIIEALKDNNYLKGLSYDELNELRKQCNLLIFQTIGKRHELYLNESLAVFENEVFGLLLQPYYDYYILNIHCSDLSQNLEGNLFAGKYLKKIVKTTFKIVNPLKGSTTEKILNPLNFYCPENFTQCEILFKMNRFRIKIDNGEYQDLTDKINSKIVDFNRPKYPKYNKRLTYTLNGEETKFTFLNEVIVDMEEERLIEFDDKIYSKRVDKPTKNLTMTYEYDNPDYAIKSDLFSILPKLMNDNIILTEGYKSIFIEVKNWLLPGNGIVIVLIPLEKASIEDEKK